jgi:hypothetical protein
MGDDMKTTLLTYAGVILIGLGALGSILPDPDLLLFAVPALIAGVILFVENLKLGIAKAVVAEMAEREWRK